MHGIEYVSASLSSVLEISMNRTQILKQSRAHFIFFCSLSTLEVSKPNCKHEHDTGT